MRKSKYTKELLEPIVSESFSMAQVIEKLGLKYTGGNFRNIDSHIKINGLDTSHFKGQAWNKGETKETNSSLNSMAEKLRYTDEQVFCLNSPLSVGSGVKLRKRLLNMGWEYKCSECDLTEWKGKPITLHIDHINGNRTDNRLENLRFLCPNCHQQTETWGNNKSLEDNDIL